MSFVEYVKQVWKAGRSGGTPWSPDRLNHMEDGIKSCSDGISELNNNLIIKGCFCKNIACVTGTFTGYGYNYCYYNKSNKIGILYFSSRIEESDSISANFSEYYDIKTVLDNMGISFSNILQSNYIPYNSTGTIKKNLVGYGTTLLYSATSQHYGFGRYYTLNGNNGLWATSEFEKNDYITGSIIFT